MIHLNFNPFPIITCNRVVLRDMRNDDAETYHIIRSDKEINKYINNPLTQTVAETLLIIERLQRFAAENKSIAWTIADKTTDALIGGICIWNMLGNEDSWELGYSMLTQYHGKGLMSEALAAAVDYGFNTMNLQVIHAHTHKDNIASIRLLEKAKFTRNTTLEAALPEEEINILVVYSLYKG